MGLTQNIIHAERVSEILKNEKYTGNALLQKKYVTDHLAKTLVWNKGALPQYYAEDTHCAIVDKDTFNKAQEIMERNRESSKGKKEAGKYVFTSKIECSKCGKKYKRKTSNGRIYWSCGTYLKYGKESCNSKQIPERILQSIISEVLERTDFDETIFDGLIEKIIVSENNKLIFTFRDGNSVEKTWENKSRSESWTEEMKQNARDRNVERRSSQCVQQNR
ncbi:MAG: recombinase zinc beta ribbon domain-containing protein [Desulfitobacteriaceae bacterium]